MRPIGGNEDVGSTRFKPQRTVIWSATSPRGGFARFVLSLERRGALVPPLRERRAEIAPLAGSFARSAAARSGRHVEPEFSRDVGGARTLCLARKHPRAGGTSSNARSCCRTERVSRHPIFRWRSSLRRSCFRRRRRRMHRLCARSIDQETRSSTRLRTSALVDDASTGNLTVMPRAIARRIRAAAFERDRIEALRDCVGNQSRAADKLDCLAERCYGD